MATGNNTATFAQVPRTATALVNSAVAGLAAPGTAAMLLVTGASISTKNDINGNPMSYGGSIVTRLTAMPLANAVVNSLLLYLSNDQGVTLRLIDSETLPAQTVSTGAGINETTFANYSETRPLRIGAGDRLYVGSQVALAAGIVFKAEYTDF